MTYTTLKEVPQKIQSLQRFKGNSISGQNLLYKDRVFYTVFSYNTPIFGVCRATGEIIINLGKYSVTTSRHQNVVQYALNDMDDYGCAREIYDLPRCDISGFFGRFA